jgi:hypothetical protein
LFGFLKVKIKAKRVAMNSLDKESTSGQYWLSQRPKYNQEEIFNIAQHYILEGTFYAAFKPLRLLIARNHEEATLLHTVFETYGTKPNPNFDRPFEEWAKGIFSKCQDPRALKYWLWFSGMWGSSPEDEVMTKDLAESGEAMMQYRWGQRFGILHGQPEVSTMWYQRAAQQGFSRAVHALSILSNDPKEKCELAVRAFHLGHRLDAHLHRSFSWLALTSDEYKLFLLAAEAKDFMMTDHSISKSMKHKLALTGCRGQHKLDAIRRNFVVGRELDDGELYYPVSAGRGFLADTKASVAIYRQMASLARQVSIHTIIVLRQAGLVKDVSVLISKVVYATRSDPCWYRQPKSKP